MYREPLLVDRRRSLTTYRRAVSVLCTKTRLKRVEIVESVTVEKGKMLLSYHSPSLSIEKED